MKSQSHILSRGAATRWFVGLIVAFAALHYVIYLLFPMLNDDMWYAERIFPYINGEQTTFPWAEIGATIRDHFRVDNVRLANIFLIFQLLMPKWVAAIFPGVAVGYLLRGCCRVAGAGPSRLPAAVLMALLLSVCFPWFEWMFSLCFSSNYVVSAAMFVWAWGDFLSDKQYSGSRRVLSLCNALLLGAWTEAYSMPFLAGIIVWWLMRRRLTHKQWSIAIALAIGTAYVVISRLIILTHPGSAEDVAFSMANVIKVMKLQVPLFCYLFLLTIYSVRCDKQVWRRPEVVIGLTAVVIALVLNFVVPRGERISSIVQIVSICGIVKLLAELLPEQWFANRRVPLIIAAVVTALLGWHYMEVIKLTDKIDKQWSAIAELMYKNPNGPQTAMTDRWVFADVIAPEQESLLTWRKPAGGIFEWYTMLRYTSFARTRGYKLSEDIEVIPIQLRNVTSSSGEAIPGTAGLRQLDGWIFRAGDSIPEWSYPTEMPPFTKQMHFYYYPFRSEKDGKIYWFMMPQLPYFPSFLLEIKKINIQKHKI